MATFFLLTSCEKEELVKDIKSSKVKSLTDLIIPAIQKEFYSYSAEFSVERPLYYMMSCKANKDQPAKRFSIKELDLTFTFGYKAASLNSANNSISQEILRTELNGRTTLLNKTEIRNANISAKEFYNCFNEMNESILLDIFNASTEKSDSKKLYNGQILSVKTSTGKYGLILVKEVSNNSIQIDACHILK